MDTSDFAPNENDVDKAGADAVLLKLKFELVDASFVANGFDTPLEALKEKGGFEEFCEKGLTGVGPNPNEIPPIGLFSGTTSRTGLSSMLIPSSSFEGGVTGRAGVEVPKVNGDWEDGGSTDFVGVPKVKPIEPDEGAEVAGVPNVNEGVCCADVGAAAGIEPPNTNGEGLFCDSLLEVDEGIPNANPELLGVPPKSGLETATDSPPMADELLEEPATGGAPNVKEGGFCSVALGWEVVAENGFDVMEPVPKRGLGALVTEPLPDPKLKNVVAGLSDSVAFVVTDCDNVPNGEGVTPETTVV